MTCSESVLSSIDEHTDFETLDLEDRLEKHLTLWDAFNKIQSELEDNLIDESETLSHETERTNFENRFHKISGLFKKYIKNPCSSLSAMSSRSNLSDNNIPLINESLRDSQNTSPPNQSTTTSTLEREGRENEVGPNENQVRFDARFELPKLQTPIFYGSFDTWLTFYDSFKSMCHNNQALAPIQKFHYLKACIKGEAAEVIASLETTGQNYQVAWELLKSRYDNEKYIVESHVNALFDIPNISREFSIRALLDNVQKRIRALKALGQPVEQWDTLLIHIIREKLNNYNSEKWEGSVVSTRLPSLTDMIAFLERRSLIENSHFTNQATHKEIKFQKTIFIVQRLDPRQHVCLLLWSLKQQIVKHQRLYVHFVHNSTCSMYVNNF